MGAAPTNKFHKKRFPLVSFYVLVVKSLFLKITILFSYDDKLILIENFDVMNRIVDEKCYPHFDV